MRSGPGLAWVAAFLLACAVAGSVAISPVAAQQGTTNRPALPTPVLIVDTDRIYLESRYGQQVRAQLDVEAADLKVENDRIVAMLTEEERSLTLRRPDMDSDVFRAEAEAFDTKVEGIRRARDAKEVALQTARVTARDDFFNDVRDVVGQLMLDRGATVVLDRRSVFLALSASDVTDEAVARIDAQLPTAPAIPQAPAPAVDMPLDDTPPGDSPVDSVTPDDAPALGDVPVAPLVPAPALLP